MLDELFPRRPNRRFQTAPISAILTKLRMAQEMIDQAARDDDADSPANGLRLSAGDYFWRPWYAKTWWVAVAFYWGILAIAPFVKEIANFVQSPAGLIVIVFNPLTAAALLGLGYLRSKVASGEWILADDDDQKRPRIRSVSGSSDPFTDPYDPSSGTLYRHHHGNSKG